MPESCVPMYLCGTFATGWLNGKHPTVREGVVSRQVCFHFRDDCCFHTRNIRIRNCGGFYVYELKAALDCPARYCGGTFDSSNLTSRLPIFYSFFPLIFPEIRAGSAVYLWCFDHNNTASGNSTLTSRPGVTGEIKKIPFSTPAPPGWLLRSREL